MDTPSGKGSSRGLDPELGLWFAELAHRAGGREARSLGLRAWLELAEAWRIREALRDSRGNRSAAARALGIGRRTLYTKMGKLGIEPGWTKAGDPAGARTAAGPA
jgi:DNA-binding NtrC family response regulator